MREVQGRGSESRGIARDMDVGKAGTQKQMKNKKEKKKQMEQTPSLDRRRKSLEDDCETNILHLSPYNPILFKT